MLLASLIVAVAYGNKLVPHGDELYLLGGKYGLDVKKYADDLTTPSPSLTIGWVWQQHAEHRIPLAKFLWLAVLKLTNYNFLVGNLLVVLAFGVVAAAMISSAKAVRGYTSYADAFFPISILNLSQSMDYLWWFCIHHVLPSLLASTLLIIIVTRGKRFGFGDTLLTSLCLVLLSLSGPGAFPFVLALAVWVVYWSVRSECPAAPIWRKALPLALVALAVLLMVLSYIGFDPSQGLSGYSPSLPAAVKATLQLASLSVGTAPLQHGLWRYTGSAVIALTLGSIAVLAIGWNTQPEERFRALGLLLFLGAMGTLVIAMAWGRGGMGESYIFVGHYVPRIVPALCCIYFVFIVYGGRIAGALVPMSLLTLGCVLLWPNVTMGLTWGTTSGFGYRNDFERDLRAGLPPLILAEWYGHNLGNDDVETVSAVLRKLKRDAIGEFRNMRSDPAFLEIAVPIKPVLTSQVTLEGRTGYATGNDPYLVFALEEPTQILAIRLKLSYPGVKSQPAALQISWKQPGTKSFGEPSKTFATRVDANAKERTVTAWVNHRIDGFRIEPDDGPCIFTISQILLLVERTK
jgi:hypothetical protein